MKLPSVKWTKKWGISSVHHAETMFKELANPKKLSVLQVRGVNFDF